MTDIVRSGMPQRFHAIIPEASQGDSGPSPGQGQEESRPHLPAPELTAEVQGWHRHPLMRKVTVQCRRLREPGGGPWPSPGVQWQGKGI